MNEESTVPTTVGLMEDLGLGTESEDSLVRYRGVACVVDGFDDEIIRISTIFSGDIIPGDGPNDDVCLTPEELIFSYRQGEFNPAMVIASPE